MKVVIKLLLFVTLMGFINCGGSDINIPNERTGDDVRNDFQNLNLLPGINDVTLESTISGIYWNFRIIVPEDASDVNKRPLILRLHGGASNVAPEAHKSTSCLAEPGFEMLNAFIISPNSDGYFWHEQQNQVQILALLDLAKSYLPVDVDKVVVMGYSDGGNGSWFYADFYSELFSAAIPIASSYNPIGAGGVVPSIDIPLYVIHGENDELFPIAQTEEWVQLSIDAGSDIEFVSAEGLTHFAPCDYVSYVQDAAVWLQSRWNN